MDVYAKHTSPFTSIRCRMNIAAERDHITAAMTCPCLVFQVIDLNGNNTEASLLQFNAQTKNIAEKRNRDLE